MPIHTTFVVYLGQIFCCKIVFHPTLISYMFGIISQLRLSRARCHVYACTCIQVCSIYTALSQILFLTTQIQSHSKTHSHLSHTHLTIRSLNPKFTSHQFSNLTHNRVLEIYSTTSQHYSNSISYILPAY